MNSKEWKIEYEVPDVPVDFVDAGLMPLLSLALVKKGAKNLADAFSLLSVELDETCTDPFSIKNMDSAVARINEAIDNNEKVAVYGDYDVDGITSTCLLTDYLRSRGLEVTPYIPDRNEEGYGLNSAALENFSGKGISLIITVDCGITAKEECIKAKELGIEMIITDHHECKEAELPEAVAVIDCKQPNDEYRFKYLAGVGTAFKLVCALDGNSNAMLEKYCDLVAIGTVADVMPLESENRCYVAKGIEKIKRSPRPGILALLTEAGFPLESLNASSIGFILAPRINAAGRLNEAITAFNLLMSDNHQEAIELANKLQQLNDKRKDIENEIWCDAKKMLEGYSGKGPIVLYSSEWNQGVIGIAASRLAEKYNVPAIMIYLNNEDIGKGSCRSYGGFNLFDALNACSESLISFGGHALAAGLNIRRDNIERFKKELTEYYIKNQPEQQEADVICDLLITNPSLLSLENVKSLNRLEPYGNGNPHLTMCLCGAKIETQTGVGKTEQHLKLVVSYKGTRFNCIFFSHTAQELNIHSGDIVDIAFVPQINEFRGISNVQLNVSAIRKHQSSEICENILSDDFTYYKAASAFCPERPDFVRLWDTLTKMESLSDNMFDLIDSLPSFSVPETYCICIKVFEELGLITSALGGHINKMHEKVELDSAEIMKRLHRENDT